MLCCFYLFELILDDFISVSLPDTCQPGGLECVATGATNIKVHSGFLAPQNIN